MTNTQHVRVEGASYQRGRQYGTQAGARVRLSVQADQQAFAHFAGWDWPTVRREAARFEAPIGQFRPAYLEEMRGIADGAGLDLTDVLAINVRTEVMYSAKARHAPRAAPSTAGPSTAGPSEARHIPAECSAFAHVPAPGQPGSVILGQNWDWLLHSAQTLVVLEARPDDGPNSATASSAWPRPGATTSSRAGCPTLKAHQSRRLKAAGAVILGKTNVPPMPGRLADRQPDLWPHQQSARPLPLARRLLGRQRRGAGRRHGPARDGHRHRRLDPRACPLLRRVRPQADGRAGCRASAGAPVPASGRRRSSRSSDRWRAPPATSRSRWR